LNGSLTPFTQTEGLYFNPETEPQNQEFEMVEELTDENEKKGYLVAQVGDKGNPNSYYDSKMRILNTAKEITSNKVKNPDILEIEFEEDYEGTVI
jgi:hypothetical protein